MELLFLHLVRELLLAADGERVLADRQVDVLGRQAGQLRRNDHAAVAEPQVDGWIDASRGKALGGVEQPVHLGLEPPHLGERIPAGPADV